MSLMDTLEAGPIPAEAFPARADRGPEDALEIRLPLAHACVVRGAIPSGRVESLDAFETVATAGVLAVLTHQNAPRLHWPIHPAAPTEIRDQWLPLQDNRIHFRGQCLAVVIGESAEAAREGAARLRVHARADVYDFAAHDRTYRSLYLNYDPLESRVTVADWTASGLTLQEAAPWVPELRTAVAMATGWPEKKVRVVPLPGEEDISGHAHFAWPHSVLAAMASRQVERPVRLLA
jgi:xanthine dehydrogenase YagR molybdenum-binding subunit